ncbi:putative NADH-flavin reductase [Leptospira ryugenii]|uniref:Putative NADH-flavin reductase n=1 Tax=Leptospira ryugenii TaxID=1917863 RepID=A0A2P2E4U2_9LEPT|nr:putative NADH-flavin reductase [Leptospira ryugenii]
MPIPLLPTLTAHLGSALDPEAVKNTIVGANTIIVTLGLPIQFSHCSFFSQATKNIIDAMLGWNPKAYLLVVTGIGAGDSKGHGSFFYAYFTRPFLLRALYKDKDRQENLVKKSALDWSICRPGFLTNGPLTGVYRVLEDLTDVRAENISRFDCADYLIREATYRNYLKKTTLVG